jgi:uncharacterized protein YkwD
MTRTQSAPRALLVALLASAVLATPAAMPEASAAPTAKERRVLQLVNKARADRGIRVLKMNESLRRKAHRHSVRMSKEGRLFHHSCLTCLASGDWNTIGENVAKARTIRRAHRALMKSPPHRRNILCGCYRKAGMGVAKRGGWFYVTQIFLG